MSRLKRSNVIFSCLSVLALAGTSTPLTAQEWPTKPLKIIVPFSAGGSLDGTTRLVALRLSERLQQQVLVENVTGAGGSIGFQRAIQAAPDGYTFLMAGDSPLNPNAPTGGPYYTVDVLKELQPVALVNTAPMVLVTNPSMPVKNLSELVALAKRNPGKYSYASSGIGTLPHLSTEMIKQAAGFHMVHIPYRGGGQIANDVAGKQVDLAMLIAASATPFIQAKTLKPLAVTGGKRLALLPDVPTVAETPGMEQFSVVSWAGLYAPAKTSAATIKRLNHEVDEILKSEAVRETLARAGALPGGGSPSAFTQFIEQDRIKLGKILQVTPLRD
jgi:tripartite-type tricarboxylate transporter receptor subunit TctC